MYSVYSENTNMEKLINKVDFIMHFNITIPTPFDVRKLSFAN